MGINWKYGWAPIGIGGRAHADAVIGLRYAPFSALGTRSTSLLMNIKFSGRVMRSLVVQPRHFCSGKFCTTPLSRLRMRSKRMCHVPSGFRCCKFPILVGAHAQRGLQ